MKIIELKEFVTKGKFGTIELGMHINDVIEYLGEPEGETDFDNGNSEISYAWYEFFYVKKTGILYGIQNDHLSSFSNFKTGKLKFKDNICFKNESFSIDIWFLKKTRYLVLEEVEKVLQKENINFKKSFLYENTILTLDSKVELEFAIYLNETGKLYSDNTSELNLLNPNQYQTVLVALSLWNRDLSS
jgi:hypothetical protein